MDFRLSDDQRAIADSAAAVFADYCSDDQLRAHDRSADALMQPLWDQCVAAGLQALLLPEAAGGLGLGMTDLMVVLQAQGRALAPVPLWEHQLAAAVLQRAGGHAATVAAAADGAGRLTIDLSGLLAPRGAGVRVERTGDGWRARGLAPAVPQGADSARALLVADTPDGPRLLAVEPAALRVVPGRSQHHQGVADLYFDDVGLAPQDVLPAETLAWAEPRAIAALAALQVGVTERQLERTVAYVSERQQFGRVIGSFQLVAGQMADGHIALESLRSSLWQVAYRLDAGLGCQPQALALRVLACETGHRAGHMAQHVHGGIGVDISYPIHRHLYWSRALSQVQGGAEGHLARLGDWLADHDQLGWKHDLPEDISEAHAHDL